MGEHTKHELINFELLGSQMRMSREDEKIIRADERLKFAEKIKDKVPFRTDEGDYSEGFNACSKKVLDRIDFLLKEGEQK